MPATNIRDGGGGISSWRKTRNGGVLRSWISDGSANPTSSISALPLARPTGLRLAPGSSPANRSASITVKPFSTAYPTALPIRTPRTPSITICTELTEITKRCFAPRLFIKATVSIRRCANLLADMAIATALSNRLITAVRDKNLCARSVAFIARWLLSSWLRTRTDSGNSSSTAA